jgi:cellulose synthase/poly-beta-1,6-N-acetylglucosamine synthase-like glycosyltransferase
MGISLCLTVLNEADRVSEWVKAIRSQTLQPDEVIIVDGGSEDGTMWMLEERLMFHYSGGVFYEPECNIRHCKSPVARGRNLAVRYAAGDILVFTDLGCLPGPDWLSMLVGSSIGVDVAYGYSATLVTDKLSGQIDKLLRKSFDSARSLAITREAWNRLGGFPEVSLCAEDTLLAENVKRLGLKVRYCPAVVWWISPKDPRTFLKQQARYATGDGISRLRMRWYASIVVKHCLFPLYWPFLFMQYPGAFGLKLRLDFTRVRGYIAGLINSNAQSHDTRMSDT